MGFSGYGFNGGLTEAAWADLSRMVGARYTIMSDSGRTHFRATKTAAKTATIAAGKAQAGGVLVHMDAAETVTFTLPLSGTRYDAVCLRRDWAGSSVRASDGAEVGGAASLVVVQGSETYQLPAARNSTQGVMDDQPLWLAELNTTGIVNLHDMRAFPAPGGIDGWDLLCAPTPEYGTVVRCRKDGKTYHRTSDASGTPRWAPMDGPPTMSTTGNVGVMASGWASGSCSASQLSGLTVMHLEARRSGGDIAVSSGVGNIGGDPTVLTLAAGLRPARYVRSVPFSYWQDNAERTGHATIQTDGQVRLVSGTPNCPITKKTSGISFSLDVTYVAA